MNLVGSFLKDENYKPIEADTWNRGLNIVCTLNLNYLYLSTVLGMKEYPSPQIKDGHYFCYDLNLEISFTILGKSNFLNLSNFSLINNFKSSYFQQHGTI